MARESALTTKGTAISNRRHPAGGHGGDAGRGRARGRRVTRDRLARRERKPTVTPVVGRPSSGPSTVSATCPTRRLACSSPDAAVGRGRHPRTHRPALRRPVLRPAAGGDQRGADRGNLQLVLMITQAPPSAAPRRTWPRATSTGCCSPRSTATTGSPTGCASVACRSSSVAARRLVDGELRRRRQRAWRQVRRRASPRPRPPAGGDHHRAARHVAGLDRLTGYRRAMASAGIALDDGLEERRVQPGERCAACGPSCGAARTRRGLRRIGPDGGRCDGRAAAERPADPGGRGRHRLRRFRDRSRCRSRRSPASGSRSRRWGAR